MENYFSKTQGNIMNVNKCHRIFDGKKAYLNYPPKWVTVGITGSCNFKCDFCCSHSPESGKNNRTKHQYKMPFNLSVDNFKKIIDMCHEGGVPNIHVCGTGEPFIHPQILELLDYVISVYFCVSLQTDFGKLLFERKNILSEIICRKDHITYITTDIFPKEIHNGIKKGSDFNYLLKCMEKISKETDIVFKAHVLLTKKSSKGITGLLHTLHERKINFLLEIVNLFPLGFNDFTSIDNVYMSSDQQITAELNQVKTLAKELNFKVIVPPPWDIVNKEKDPCLVFWEKVQTMPSKKISRHKWPGNAIPQQCPAVVLGEISSIGNLLEYGTFMEFWNNDVLVNIRKRIMSGKLPDEACRQCYIGCHGNFRKNTLIDKTGTFLLEHYHNLKNLYHTA